MKQAYIVKLTNNSYDLIAEGLLSTFGFNVLATISQKSYDMMLDCLQGLRNGLSGFYQFPHYDTMPELRVIIQKYDTDSIVLHLQLGNFILSDMNDSEFEELIRKLVELKNQPIGSKVYFV